MFHKVRVKLRFIRGSLVGFGHIRPPCSVEKYHNLAGTGVIIGTGDAPLLPSGLAELSHNLRGQLDPPGGVWLDLDPIQATGFAPGGDGRDIDVQ